jgi:hypothetical protein
MQYGGNDKYSDIGITTEIPTEMETQFDNPVIGGWLDICVWNMEL